MFAQLDDYVMFLEVVRGRLKKYRQKNKLKENVS